MSTVVDRRLNGKNKAATNRERFLKRYKDHIKESISDNMPNRSITDTKNGGDVSIPKRSLDEPFFHHGDGGDTDKVFPGNEEYQEGDQLWRPRRGKGGKNPSNSGDVFDDDFIFTLTKEEFLEYLFDGMELPDLVKTELIETNEVSYHRAGYTPQGTASNLHVIKSLKCAIGRRRALGGKTQKQLDELLEELEELDDEARKAEILEEVALLRGKLAKLPFIDPFDLKYRNTVEIPNPEKKAVMFCIMDVSGSMMRDDKDMAKRFFILLYLFLTKSYEHIEVVFIRHTETAEEVDEQTFFYGQESGGTEVSSALLLTDQIIKERYAAKTWNIYVAQASDGDNFDSDSDICIQILSESILPLVQYYAYVEIADGDGQSLWYAYQKLLEAHPNLSVKNVSDISEIYPVFKDLFRKKAPHE